MSFPFYHQRDSMDCGPTCLRMVVKHYGKNISITRLRSGAQATKEGASLLGLSEAAESIGLRSQAVRLNLTMLAKDVPLPCILYWNQVHFIVLYKVKKGSNMFRSIRGKSRRSMLIADPDKGLLTLAEEDFLQGWVNNKNKDGVNEGIALLLEPSPAFESFEDDQYSSTERQKGTLAFINLFKYIVPYRKLVFQLLIGMGIASILQTLLPFLMQSIVDIGINTANLHFVYIVLIAQLALFAGGLVTNFVRGWILLHISSRVNISILTDFLIKMMKLPLSFFDSKRIGDILQRMSDHQRIESFLTSSSINMLVSIVNVLIFGVILAIFNTTIFIVFLISSVAYSLWVALFMRHRKLLDYKRFDVASREQSATLQLVQAMQEIKLNGIERRMRWKWEHLQARLFRLSVKSLSLNQWQQAGASFINEGKNIFITFLSARAVIYGQMTLGAMVAVQYIIGQLNSPIEQMVGFLQGWQNAKLSVERLNEIHGLEDEEPADRPFLQELPLPFTRQVAGGQGLGAPVYGQENTPILKAEAFLPGSYGHSKPEKFHYRPLEASAISFTNMSFTYTGAGNEPVLKDINLRIPLGKTTAIVGISGSGKTTLLKLLLKFYEPQQGEIRLGNTLLRNVSHKVWRKRCGTVMQDSVVFSDTIANNISIEDENPDMNRLHQAVEAANIGGFIESLALGFNTKIGSAGTGISVGQKQRLLIARAIYRDPDFIFFDEATNSLDANNERIIIDNLRSFFKERTVIVVAHRLSTVRHADQIVVLNDGFIKERGTHQELVNLRREYYTLVKNQLELGE